ncbi:hypothetical protein [Streptomyces sp. NPDC048669]|uniref:hypothetical protein n=1 Tax=Streptomyces sp. NPDC048669 TaxID=3155267 RepID=UPI003421EE20
MASTLAGPRAASTQLPSWTRLAQALKAKTSSLTGPLDPFINLDRSLSGIEPSVSA